MSIFLYIPKDRYENPLADKLGLGKDDIDREAKAERLLADLHGKIRRPVGLDVNWHYREAEETGALPLPQDWRDWPVLTARSVWGNSQKHTWLLAEITVPQDAAGETLTINVSSNWRDHLGSTDPQCLAYLNGQVAQAIDGNHTELVIARDAVPGETHLVQVNAFSHDDRPMLGFPTEGFLRDDRIETLYYTLSAAFDVACQLTQTDIRRHAILDRVERALFALDRREGQYESLLASLPAAEKIASEINDLAPDEMKPVISAFGHTHLDVAWLWRVKHVRDKTARSFATALDLMDEFPDFIFMYNQAILFDFLKQDYPEIWERVKQKVRSGQLDIEGAMWVEPDANISSGESLVRQIMRGRKFHEDEFGITPKCVWLPDTFGYSAAMPQILAQCGVEYFVTSKLSWNDTDRLPYDTFFWRGIDGSKLKSHLLTTQPTEARNHGTMYNSTFTVSEIMGAWKRYEPKALNDDIMMCYGHGDGGGGPTRAMVKRGIAMARGIPGAPEIRLEGLRPHLDRLGAKMDDRAEDFPVWDGELYLQYHRGTLTSVAKNKANNRNAERAMRELEFAASMSTLMSGAAYPKQELQDLWDIVLINQFHDILPGTSIVEAYEDSDAEYADLFDRIRRPDGLLNTALGAAGGTVESGFHVVNFTAQPRGGDLVYVTGQGDLSGLTLCSGDETTPLQEITRADGQSSFAGPVQDIPSLGWAPAQITRAKCSAETSLSVSETHLENDLIRVQFDANAEISSVLDKQTGRELIQPGKLANQLVAYEDKPKDWDAWDIDHYFEEKSWPLSETAATIDVVETGPHRAALRIGRSYARSTITQVISLQAGHKLLEFDTMVDWQERQTLLKTAFPLNLNVSETRAEIQFGHVKRPTHQNTSWDQARFETSMHRWVDMSEPDFGAALLNDCKYGYDAVEQTLRLTLLKGAVAPDPNADLGVHNFRYALLLHDGERDLSAVVQAGERFNNPLMVQGTVAAADTAALGDAQSFSFAQVGNEGLTLETVKLAEDGTGVILRLIEHANRVCSTTISFGLPVAMVLETDLLEQENGRRYDVHSGAIEISMKPFEIRTLKVILA